VLGDITGVTGLKILWVKYQEVIAELDQVVAAQLRTMRRQTELPPLPPKPRVRGRKPHGPAFNVREALYYLLGVDLTDIEGIDELHALTPSPYPLLRVVGEVFRMAPLLRDAAEKVPGCIGRVRKWLGSLYERLSAEIRLDALRRSRTGSGAGGWRPVPALHRPAPASFNLPAPTRRALSLPNRQVRSAPGSAGRSASALGVSGLPPALSARLATAPSPNRGSARGAGRGG